MAENDAEEGGKGGLVKKILIFGGGGILLIAIGLGAGYLVFGSTQPDPSEQIEEIIEHLHAVLRMRHLRMKLQAIYAPNGISHCRNRTVFRGTVY